MKTLLFVVLVLALLILRRRLVYGFGPLVGWIRTLELVGIDINRGPAGEVVHVRHFFEHPLRPGVLFERFERTMFPVGPAEPGSIAVCITPRRWDEMMRAEPEESYCVTLPVVRLGPWAIFSRRGWQRLGRGGLLGTSRGHYAKSPIS